jgi:hypothetical protein
MGGVGRFEMCRTVVIVATIKTAKKIPVRAEKTKRVFIEAPRWMHPKARLPDVFPEESIRF